MSQWVENLRKVRERMEAAALRAGRSPGDIELIAVSKTFPAEVVSEVAAEHDLFGESRAQEIVAKAPQCPSRLRWHFIGHLQSNKVRKVLPLVEAIHSVDSSALAADISRIAEEAGVRPDVYLQVNIAEDGSKFGFTPEQLQREFSTLLDLPRLNIIGLMTIPPLVPDPEMNRQHFASLRHFSQQLASSHGLPQLGLSMGMSDDFEVAIAEGATIVRVGSAIFGKRRSVMARRPEEL